MKILDLHIPLDEEIGLLADLLDHNLFAVGGVVRDAVFEHYHETPFEPKDIDIATSKQPEEVLAVLRSRKAQGLGVKALEIGKSFGVVAAVFGDKTYEIATFRSEWYDPDLGDGRHPDKVVFSTPEEDAKRRDLTINALFYNIGEQRVYDFNETGLHDVENKIIRPVGSADARFAEDRLRVLRIVRFYCRYRTDNIRDGLNKETLEAIWKWKHLPGVSGERIAAEFMGGLNKSLVPALFLESLLKLDLYQAIFPGVVVQKSAVYAANSRNTNVVMALLLDEEPKTLAKKLNALKYDSATFQRAAFLKSLAYFRPEEAFLYLKDRDRQVQGNGDMEGLRKEMVFVGQILGMDKATVEYLADFKSGVKATDFPHLEGPELGAAIREAITNQFMEMMP